MDMSGSSDSNRPCREVKPEVKMQGVPKDLPKRYFSMVSSQKLQQTIFSLTLNEIHVRSGLSFGSMNIKELLTTVTSLDFQINNFPSVAHKVRGQKIGVITTTFYVPPLLIGKTVDEIWAEIQGNSQSQSKQGGFDFARLVDEKEFVHTLGEMKLEDFLIAAGFERGPTTKVDNIDLNNPSAGSGSYFGDGSCLNPLTNIGLMMGYDFPTRINSLKSDGTSALKIGTEGSGGVCNKSEEVDEASDARRKRRMMKNRESAARSRARKLAYTAELEKELGQQTVQIAKLKFALEQAELKLKEALGEKESEEKGREGPLRRIKRV